MTEKKHFKSHNINKFNLTFSNSLMECRVFWARVVSSENESLFTQYTKHTFYEIEYALEGKIDLIIGKNDKLRVNENDFVIIPPDTYHQIIDNDSEGARFIMAFEVQFKDERLSRASERLGELTPRSATEDMRELLDILLEKRYRDTPVRKRMITSLLESFFLEIVEVMIADAPVAEENGYNEVEARLGDILAYIHQHGGVGISVSDIARKFNISERHLSRTVLSLTGKSPKEHINYEKLKRIEEYMVSTSLSLGEIAELCGFSDSYAMNKFFKRYNKVSPTVFRKPTK
ncbi:MAG: helix-turn-helix domain-containing protein [Clostridia bacterium]|nr:helix-turn-helix domain-containing protein [Clostridia bacterium]